MGQKVSCNRFSFEAKRKKSQQVSFISGVVWPVNWCDYDVWYRWNDEKLYWLKVIDERNWIDRMHFRFPNIRFLTEIPSRPADNIEARSVWHLTHMLNFWLKTAIRNEHKEPEKSNGIKNEISPSSTKKREKKLGNYGSLNFPIFFPFPPKIQIVLTKHKTNVWKRIISMPALFAFVCVTGWKKKFPQSIKCDLSACVLVPGFVFV